MKTKLKALLLARELGWSTSTAAKGSSEGTGTSLVIGNVEGLALGESEGNVYVGCVVDPRLMVFKSRSCVSEFDLTEFILIARFLSMATEL